MGPFSFVSCPGQGNIHNILAFKGSGSLVVHRGCHNHGSTKEGGKDKIS